MIDKSRIVYLACPYAPTEKQVAAKMPVSFGITLDYETVKELWATVRESIMATRCDEADKAAAWLMEQGYVVLSPISHSHGIAQHMAPGKRVDHALWMKQDRPFVRASDVMVVLTLDGWRESKGIEHERQQFLKRPACSGFFYINRTPNGYELSERPA
jgi:hypothetical protein